MTHPASDTQFSQQNVLDKIREVNPHVATDLIARAYAFSLEAHRNQYRKSGESFLSHPVSVALILAEQQLDATTIAAGLLHDVLEDTGVTYDTLAGEFGEHVAGLVDGVTKIEMIESKSIAERQAETYRKLIFSMARDIRVIIIKFADRIHNLRTLQFLKKEKIRAVAHETLDIYAPLAHRLGMQRIKVKLEDLAFMHLHPQQYKEIVSKVVATQFDRELIIDNFVNPIRHRLEQEGIKATVIGRPKHFYSIYQKMKLYNRPFEEIYDLLAIRIITDSVRTCYYTLGIIHSLWKPIQERFKDYISAPKTNGYQSLHTTVVGGSGNIVEIQIRTHEMNQTAEEGIAAHWMYKQHNGSPISEKESEKLGWLKNIIEWQKELPDSSEFFENFKIDLFSEEIFIFTPQGDLISLPQGSTVLDFAFSVHTELGLKCIGAKVDGKAVHFDAPLQNGSTVEILHSSHKEPTIEHLAAVKTPKAKSAIKRHLKNKEKKESIELGKKIVKAQYHKLTMREPFTDHVGDLLQHMGINSLDRLYELVARGDIPISRVMHYFKYLQMHRTFPDRIASRFAHHFGGNKHAVVVGDSTNKMVRLAKCCNPIPHDDIIGFITTGRGISVHRTDCEYVKLFKDKEYRSISVQWDTKEDIHFIAIIEIVAHDTPGLLYEITSILMQYGANIREAEIKTADTHAYDIFRIDIKNKNQLKQIIRRIEKLKKVKKVVRTHKDF